MKKILKNAAVFTLALATFAVFTMPAGAATVEELQAQISALLAQITALQSQLANTGGTTSGGALYNWTRDLTLGSTGADVKALQQFLNGHGAQVAASGAGSAGNESEYFGQLTKAALATFQAANGISPAVGYFGPITRSYIASNYAGTGTGTGTGETGGGTTTPTTSGFSLASGNPSSTAVPAGSTGVTFLKFNITGSGTVDSLTFKRVGLGSSSDIGGVYLYKGATRLTSSKTVNSTTNQIYFPNLGLDISGTETYRLVVDVSSSATSNNSNGFKLIDASGDISLGSALTGNEMNVSGVTIGSIIVDDGAAPSNPNIGQSDALLANITLTAGSTEDVEITRLSLTEGGTISNDYLSNFELKYGGDVVATASSIGDQDLVTLEFGSPYTLEKGQQRTFKLYGDIAGSARSADTVVFYMDSSADIEAIGATYGYGVTPTITSFDTSSEGDTLTLQGAEVTVTLNGPAASDIAKNAQDVKIFDFNISSQNNIEIKNLRFSMTTTNLITGEGFNDFKVWDVDSSSVVTSAVDVSTTTTQVFTDTININAGESKHFKVTVDVDSDNDTSDTIKVTLDSFQSNDIRNLDNNTYVSTSNIVGDNAVGNTQTVQVPSVDLQLSATPTSQTYVQGTSNVSLVGLSLRAVADASKVDSIKVYATSSTGTLTTGELQNLALWDGSTIISDYESLDSSLTATFDNLDLNLSKGETKVLTVKGSISADATDTDVYSVYVNALTDVTAYDSQGNSVTISGSTANSGATVEHTITTAGSISVVAAPSSASNKSQIIVTGEESVLGEFRFTSTNEAMTVDKMQILVNESGTATATSTAAADEVPVIKLYVDGAQIGQAAGYTVTGSGNTAGVAFIEGLDWTIAKDATKNLVVKGVVNTIAGGADSGASVYVTVVGDGGPGEDFRATGASGNDTGVTAATGSEMVVYKTEPTLTIAAPSNKLAAGSTAVAEVTVAANANEQVSFKMFTLNVAATGATITNPSTSNVTVRDLSTNDTVTLATVSDGGANITGGSSDQVGIYFTSEQTIPAGSSKTYRVYLTASDLSSTVGGAYISSYLLRNESSKVAATTYSTVAGAADDEDPSFIWSDNSATSHSESSTDWANGYKVETFPSTTVTVTN